MTSKGVTWTILVVDDSANARLVLRLAFEAKGARVIEAENGRVGLAIAATEHVDLVFSDIRMPVMDGLQMIRALRAEPRHARTPIFVLTSDEVTRAEEGKKAGADAWVFKSSTPDALWRVVEKALRAV
jgi:two-component system chemotaxis response regulator CheY